MKREGLNMEGSVKCLGSFMIKETLVKNVDLSGKTKPSTVVGLVVVCGIDIGATIATLWISAIVACT